jgi:hypothetical protein
VLDRMRHLKRAGGFRHAIREKIVNVVDEAISRHRHEQADELRRVERELRDELRRLGERITDHVTDYEIRDRRDIVFNGERHAALEASAFTREHMIGARHFGHPHHTLEYALSLAPTGGLALEFGVFSGTTLKIISTARGGEKVFGFDSFEGLPTAWRSGFPAGTFRVDGTPDVPGAELVVGLFADTLPGFMDSHQGPVDFLHVDGDLYSSAKIVLDLVGPRLRPGSVIVFDEFFNFPGWQEHEYKAWREHVEQTGIEFTYPAYTYNNEQVVVQIAGG